MIVQCGELFFTGTQAEIRYDRSPVQGGDSILTNHLLVVETKDVFGGPQDMKRCSGRQLERYTFACLPKIVSRNFG